MVVFDSPTPLYAAKKVLDLTVAGYDKPKLMAFALMMTCKFKEPDDRAHIALVGPSSVGKSKICLALADLFDMVKTQDIIDMRNRRKAKFKEASEKAKKKGLVEKDVRLDDTLTGELNKLYAKKQGIVLTGVTKEVLKRWEYPYDNKIVMLTELDAALMSMGYIRQMMSEGDMLSLSTEKVGQSGKNMPMPLAVAGKAVWVATTASEEIEHQFSNRVSLIYLNPSDGEKRSALLKIAEKMGSTPNGKHAQLFAEVRKETSAFPLSDSVTIPYAHKIAESWPADVPAQNRIMADFLRLIKAVALVHGRTTALGDDYELARQIFCAQKHKLPHGLLRFLETIRSRITLKKYEKNVKGEWGVVQAMNRDEIAEATGLSDKMTAEYLAELQNKGIVVQYHRYEKKIFGHGEYEKEETVRMPSEYALTQFGKSGHELPGFDEVMGDDYDPSWFLKPYDVMTGKPFEPPEKKVKQMAEVKEEPVETVEKETRLLAKW